MGVIILGFDLEVHSLYIAAALTVIIFLAVSVHVYFKLLGSLREKARM